MPHNSSPTWTFSADPDFDFEIRCVLGGSCEGVSEPGEVLAAVAGVHKGDHEGWFDAWFALAQRTLSVAHASAADGHRVSASSAYLRASSYFGVAVNALSALDDGERIGPAFARQEEAWDGFVASTDVDVTKVAIDYGEGTLPGWWFRPARPSGATLVAVNGSDGARAALWSSCVAPALKRGYNVLIFDGPGQQSELFEGRSHFRPDWENVLTPVFDFAAGQAGVDPARIALFGISQGSFWTVRALAFEHRYAAAITDPGVVDVAASWVGHLPASMLRLLDSGDTAKFDKEMAFGLKFSPATAHTWAFRARPYGTQGYAETIEEVRRYDATEVAGRIRTPLLILSPENEQFWPGQSERLAALAPDVSTLVRFTAAEGADGHCQPLARTVTAQRMFDWLDERVAR